MASGIHRHEPCTIRSALNNHGFAAVHDLFAPADVREVEILLDELSLKLQARMRGRRHRFAGDMQPVRDLTDPDSADGIDQLEIRYAASFEPRLLKTRLFRQCEAYAHALGGKVSRAFDHAITKSVRNLSETPWHQDAAFHRLGATRPVAQMDRLHFWIPLQDVAVGSGCMEFIAGSHRTPLLRHERYERRSGSFGYATAFVDESRRVACPLPVGGATIHLPATVHFCGRNASDRPRKAWIIQFAPFGRLQLALKKLAGCAPRGISA